MSVTRRRRESEHEHEGEPPSRERWVISYADFITLLFAFFVVMYSMSSLNAERYQVLSLSLSHAFGAPTHLIAASQPAANPLPPPPEQTATLAAQRREAKKMRELAARVAQVLEPLQQQGRVRMIHSVRGIAVEINAAILFAPGQATLQEGALPALKAVAAVLEQIDENVQVEGHTDNLPIATAQFPSNWELSAARAASVVKLFIDNNVPASRLAAAGYAEFQPVDRDDTPEARAHNRRVTIWILSRATVDGSTAASLTPSTP